MMDDRWEKDTLFFVFKGDFRFRQGTAPQEAPHRVEAATFFAEPSAAKRPRWNGAARIARALASRAPGSRAPGSRVRCTVQKDGDGMSRFAFSAGHLDDAPLSC